MVTTTKVPTWWLDGFQTPWTYPWMKQEFGDVMYVRWNHGNPVSRMPNLEELPAEEVSLLYVKHIQYNKLEALKFAQIVKQYEAIDLDDFGEVRLKVAKELVGRYDTQRTELARDLANHNAQQDYPVVTTATSIRDLPLSNITALDKDAISKLTHEQIADLQPSQLKILTTDQLEGLTPKQIGLLTKDQLDGLDYRHYLNFNMEQLTEVHPGKVESLIDPVLAPEWLSPQPKLDKQALMSKMNGQRKFRKDAQDDWGYEPYNQDKDEFLQLVRKEEEAEVITAAKAENPAQKAPTTKAETTEQVPEAETAEPVQTEAVRKPDATQEAEPKISKTQKELNAQEDVQQEVTVEEANPLELQEAELMLKEIMKENFTEAAEAEALQHGTENADVTEAVPAVVNQLVETQAVAQGQDLVMPPVAESPIPDELDLEAAKKMLEEIMGEPAEAQQETGEQAIATLTAERKFGQDLVSEGPQAPEALENGVQVANEPATFQEAFNVTELHVSEHDADAVLAASQKAVQEPEAAATFDAGLCVGIIAGIVGLLLFAVVGGYFCYKKRKAHGGFAGTQRGAPTQRAPTDDSGVSNDKYYTLAKGEGGKRAERGREILVLQSRVDRQRTGQSRRLAVTDRSDVTSSNLTLESPSLNIVMISCVTQVLWIVLGYVIYKRYRQYRAETRKERIPLTTELSCIDIMP